MKNIRKSIFIRIMSLFLILSFIFPVVESMKFNFINFKTDAEETVVTNLDNVYGITYANIDTFGYYEYSTGKFGYNEYGAGMDIKFKLPKEAKEGDYFTLNYGDQLLLNKMPMYADNEEVPYASLDSQPNRYNNRHDNIFFVVKTRGDALNPYGVPLLNVYYTKKGELTFVVQKYANDKGVIEGDAIIGEIMNDPFNADSPLNKRFNAITDGNGRHVRKGKKQWGWDVDDLETQLSKYYFFTGFRPNNLLMRVQAGATLMNNHRAFIGRDITYTSKYMNANPVKLDDANGDPNKAGMFVNYETELFNYWGGGNVTSFGKEHLYPHYEDREYIYYHFIYQANKGATDSTAGRNVKIYPIDNTLDIEEIKLYKGFDSNGSLDFTNSTPNSIVPPMAYYDTGQTVQGLAFAKQGDGSWYANFNWHQHQTYFGVLRARKKTPSTFEGKDAYKIGMWSYTGTKQRTHDDYYIPTSGFGYGLADPVTPKDSIGFFKIKKTDPNKNTVNPIYDIKDGKIQYVDTYGNIFTYDESKKVYVNQNGRTVSQVKDQDNNLIFEDNLLNQYTQIVNGNNISYKDKDGNIYTKIDGKDEWKSPSGKIFKPTRPLLLEDEVSVIITDHGNDTTVTDEDGNPLTKIEMIDKNNFSIITKYGNILMIKMENGQRTFYKWDGVAKRFIKSEHVLQQGSIYHVTNLGYNPTHVRPLLKNSFVFRITDTTVNNVFEHGIDEYGYVVFPSLLEGHNYKLEEVSAQVGYIKTNKTFNVNVKSKNEIIITDSDGNPVTNNTVPMSILDSENLLYAVVNDTIGFVVSKRIKGIENTGRYITTEMEFKLSKIDDDTFSPQVIKQNANENFVFTGLTKGEYLLEETKAPAGYVIDKSVYKLIADNDGNIHFFKLSIPNTTYTYVESQKTLIKHELLNQHADGTTDNNAIDGSISTSAIWHQTDPGNTLNGSGAGEYGNNNIRVGTYVGLDLGEAKLIREIKFMQGQGNNHNDRLVKFDMEYSVDNTNWKTYKSYSNDNTSQGDVNENGLALYARYIRFVNKEPVLNKWFSIKEISAKVYENINKTITFKMQENLNVDKNIAFVGNIQNPSLVLEKVDANKNVIVKNNDGKDYNAKFKLYKVPDEKESITEEELSNFTQVQEFILNQGKTELKQFADKLGRYALVETESPNGYSKVEPILLDLVETQQDHGGGLMKNTTAWKIVGNSTQVGNSSSTTTDGYPIYTGTAENNKVFVDYSELATNKITLKVKNEKDSKKIKIKIRKIDKDKNPIIIRDGNKSPRFMITKDPNATDESGAYNGQFANLNSEDGSFTFDNMTNKFEKGLYYLRELRAPSGYILLDKSIPFYIDENGNVIIPAKLKEGTTDKYIEDENFSLKNKINVVQAGETETVQIEVVNDKALYPKAGGYGALKYVLIGSLFMCLSTAVVIKKKYYDK
ncbi:MAG: discoidin domain-containing protein [Parvimonas sp.]|uniref:SpaA isopeptide-forming pilin-related protein n=1 Tax=Parvimonas sp. TaxID=1944660 RepID=UPI0025DD4C7B|nr:SpaA isopeptide-forming pilin-related protein [Parvimonas sp.]MCI5997823.1 discoidin domain-containing protein [Parvimonas sp.]